MSTVRDGQVSKWAHKFWHVFTLATWDSSQPRSSFMWRSSPLCCAVWQNKSYSLKASSRRNDWGSSHREPRHSGKSPKNTFALLFTCHITKTEEYLGQKESVRPTSWRPCLRGRIRGFEWEPQDSIGKKWAHMQNKFSISRGTRLASDASFTAIPWVPCRKHKKSNLHQSYTAFASNITGVNTCSFTRSVPKALRRNEFWQIQF